MKLSQSFILIKLKPCNESLHNKAYSLKPFKISFSVKLKPWNENSHNKAYSLKPFNLSTLDNWFTLSTLDKWYPFSQHLTYSPWQNLIKLIFQYNQSFSNKSIFI